MKKQSSSRATAHLHVRHSDLLRQFDLEHPSRGRNRKKFQPLKHANITQTAAALSLCLVTGLSVGVGSAYAEGELPPDQAPLDQPASQTQFVVQPQVKHAHYLTQLIQDRLPIHTSATRVRAKTTPTTKHLLVTASQPPLEASPDGAPVDLAPVTVVANLQLNQGHQPSPVIQPEPPTHTTHAHHEMHTTPHHAMPTTHRVSTHHITTHNSHTLTPSLQPLTLTHATQTHSTNTPLTLTHSTPVSTKHHSTTVHPSSNLPRTVKGGQLPKTAGNDLNGMLVGSGMALLGWLYALRRGKGQQ